MVSFKDVRQSVISFITRKKESPLDQPDQKPQEQQPTRRSEFPVQKKRSDPLMNPFAKAKRWISWSSAAGGGGEPSSSNTQNQNPRKRERSPSTSPGPRKRQLLDKDHVSHIVYDSDEGLEGPTLVDYDGGDEDTEQSGLSDHANRGDSVLTDMEGDTIIGEEAEDPWGNEGSEENRGSGTSVEDQEDNGETDDSDYDVSSSLSENDDNEPPPFLKGTRELPKLDRDFTLLGSDDEYAPSRSSSEAEDSEDEILRPPRTRTRSRSRSTSRGRSGSTHSRQDVYRPSPKIVDKNLTSHIVSRHAEESDLSEEEIVHEKVAVRKDDKREVTYDETMRLSQGWVKTVTLPKGHWAHAEEDLYLRLAMRGFEPIIPSNWSIDFPTLPNTLFVHPGASEPYIHSNYETEFRAIKFLSDLLFVGNRVRDRIISGFCPEPVIGRYLNNYIKWAMRDMNLHNRPNLIPVHAIYAQRNSRDSRLALQSLNRRLVVLANRYREAWRLEPHVGDLSEPRYLDRKFPVITGFLICGPLVAILTLNSDPAVNPVLPPDTSGKIISRLDFGKVGHDVWNGLAVAISVVRVRKNILELMEDCADDPMWAVEEDMGVVEDPDI